MNTTVKMILQFHTFSVEENLIKLDKVKTPIKCFSRIWLKKWFLEVFFLHFKKEKSEQKSLSVFITDISSIIFLSIRFEAIKIEAEVFIKLGLRF